MKKTIKAGAAALLCASVFALSSCSSAATVAFNQNWYANNTLNDAKLETSETLVYDVSFSDTGENESYSVHYDDGTYTVRLSVEPNYRGKNAYKLTTTLELSGEYSRGEEKKAFSDKLESECYFRSAKDALSPVYSKKQVLSTSPLAESADSLDQAVKTYDYVVECTYADDGKSVDVTYTDRAAPDNSKEYTRKLKSSYTIVDNECLLFAIRGLNSSAYLSVFNPYTGALETVGASFATQASDKTYAFAMDGNEEKGHTMSAYSVNIGLTGTQLTGKIRTAVYAAASAHEYRNVLLQLTTPLTYSLGALEYKLKSASFTTM